MLESMATLTLQGTNTENWREKNFPEKELCGHSPNFHIHLFVSDLYTGRDCAWYRLCPAPAHLPCVRCISLTVWARGHR